MICTMVGGESSAETRDGSGSFTLSIHASTTQPDLTVLHPLGTSHEAQPTLSATGQADGFYVTLFQGYPNATNMLGTGSSSGFTHRGHPGTAEWSSSNRKLVIKCPLGSFNWSNTLGEGGTHWLFKDSAGRKLADMSKGLSKDKLAKGDKKLEIYVTNDAHLTELVVLTALILTPLTKPDRKGETKLAMSLLHVAAHVALGS